MTLSSNDIEKCILSSVKEFRGGIGFKRLSKILHGKPTLSQSSKSKKCFGVLGNYSVDEIQSFLRDLVARKVLTVSKYRGNDILRLNNGETEEITVEQEKPIIIDKSCDDENVKKALELISEHKNIFITGHAGTGKSFILEKLKENIPDMVITSTTGIAAVNVKGQTIHSWAGIGICNLPVLETVNKILDNYTVYKRIVDCKILAIDEISMLDIRTLEYTDKVFKQIRQNNLPFGGIQVVLIGDFYQLPPAEYQKTDNGYCFESPLWTELNLQTIVLTKNYRQNDENLIKALSHIRINEMTSEDEALLRTRECDFSDDELTDVLHAFGRNDEAKKYNDDNYKKLVGEEKTYNAIDTYKGKFDIDKCCRAEKEIKLKIGARVMLLINLDFDKCLINGSCGNVTELDDSYVLVKFDNGEISEIKRHDFEFYQKDRLVANRAQIPLRLAYGITIHKSQGMTLDKLVVDGKNIFAEGQIYVALSRIRTLNGLYLRNFNPKTIKVNEKVAEFYKSLGINKGI